jgi:LPS-assembly protein
MFSTLLLLCHVFVLHGLVTSQVTGESPVISRQSSGSPQQQIQQPGKPKPHLAGPGEEGEEVTIETAPGGFQEKTGDVYRLKGGVVITFRKFEVRADEITYDTKSGELTATGHLSFDGGPHDEHLEASHGTINVNTQTGRFYDVKGTTGAHFRGSHVVLTSSNPFFFSGDVVEKYGSRYVVSHGVVTSCELPKPKWTFNAEKITVDVGEEARMYHSNFRLFGVPIFYFPYAQHPVDRLGRQSGLLIPTIGQSSRKGTILGEAVYWAINRSMDATAGAEYFSHRGWSQHGEFRAKPSQDSYLDATYFGVLDRGFGSPHVDQGGADIKVNGESRLPWGFRGVVDMEYLSSFVFRLAFAETFTLAVNSEVRSNVFVSKSYNGYSFNVAASRYQNFQSTNRGDVITILHAPSFDTSSVDRKVWKTPLYWSYEASAQGVSRREPGFVTGALVGRFDVHPIVALPLHIGDWSFRPEVGLRNTYYTQRLDPSGPGIGTTVDRAINRRALDTSFEVRPPALTRIFEKKIADHTIKHTVETRVTYRYVNGVENIPEIIRFDAADILSDTNEIEYALVNRIYAKANRSTECQNPEALQEFAPLARTKAKVPGTPGVEHVDENQPECRPGPPTAREVFAWEIAQKHFFDPNFGSALVAGRRNAFTTTVDFTGIAFLTEPRRFSPIISRMRVNTSTKTDISWAFDYDTKKGLINASTVLVNHRFGDYFIAGSHAFLHVPGEVFSTNNIIAPAEFNQLRWLMGYGHPNKRGVNAAVNVGMDIHSGFMQYSAFQTSYNWDCCGFSMEYRRFALGSVRNENQFRFALSLTNVGTFGTLRRQERLF